ncbi:MAG: hydrogenase maturation protease [Clostridia bacterium]|jgi:hydrogenase maturation protease|nr:hydrogenase maturation protease [Clostridia bacterium]
MNKKVIAIGNRFMQDDGIALVVGKRIRELMVEKGVDVIISEADMNSCIEDIQPGDEVYVMDSTYYGILPGSITFSSLKSKKDKKYIASSMNGFKLMNTLMLYKKRLKVFFIGIEIASIEMKEGISKTLASKMDDICNHIIKLIL